MQTNIKILGWLHIVLHGFTLLGGLICLVIFGLIGGIFAVGGGHDALPALPIFGGIGLLVFWICLLISLPGIIIGWGLLNFAPWARILGIVISILDLFNFPLGTALGVYGLVVLCDAQTSALFERPQVGA